MKWFVMLAVIIGAYYFFVIQMSSSAIDQAMHLQQQYVSAAARISDANAPAAP